jgi:hypothetical protein
MRKGFKTFYRKARLSANVIKLRNFKKKVTYFYGNMLCVLESDSENYSKGHHRHHYHRIFLDGSISGSHPMSSFRHQQDHRHEGSHHGGGHGEFGTVRMYLGSNDDTWNI